MLLNEQGVLQSWHCDDSPMVFSEIFSPETSITIWRRPVQADIARYFDQVFVQLRTGIRSVFSVDALEAELNGRLPEGTCKASAVADICLLADMLTTLFNCDSVGLRLVPLSSPMCPSFHVDNIPVRLIHTYVGSGTDWLPGEALQDSPPDDPAGHFARTNTGKYFLQSEVRTLGTFDAALLKGAAWPEHEHMAAVHRSGLSRNPAAQSYENRVLLTLDPM